MDDHNPRGIADGEITGAYSRLRKFSKLLRAYQLADLDAFAGVTGYKGMGKTSFSIQVSRVYLRNYFKEKYFAVQKHLAFDNEEIKEKIATHDRFRPFIADEAARFAMGEDWMKAESKELKKILAQCRTPSNLIAFLNIPKLKWMDTKYLGGLINLWVWIPTRGLALYFIPDINPGQDDPWHLSFFKKKIKYMSQFTAPDKIIKIVEKHPCYKDYVTFPKVPEKIYARYHEIRTERTQGEQLKGYRTQRQLANLAAMNLYYYWPDIQAAIENTRQRRPTWRLLAEQLFKDPRTKKPAVAFSGLRKVVKEFADSHGIRLEQTEEPKQGEPQPKEPLELEL